MHINFYPAYIKDLITLPKTVFSLRGTDILSLCRPASASYGLPSLSHPSHRTEYNAYCLGTFTSSSTKFVDLSTDAQPCIDAMKYDEGGKLNNDYSTLLFSPSSSLVLQNRSYEHISLWTLITLLCCTLREFPFVLAPSRFWLCRKRNSC